MKNDYTYLLQTSSIRPGQGDATNAFHRPNPSDGTETLGAPGEEAHGEGLRRLAAGAVAAGGQCGLVDVGTAVRGRWFCILHLLVVLHVFSRKRTSQVHKWFAWNGLGK